MVLRSFTLIGWQLIAGAAACWENGASSPMDQAVHNQCPSNHARLVPARNIVLSPIGHLMHWRGVKSRG